MSVRIIQVIPAPPGLVNVWADKSGPVADPCDLLALVELVEENRNKENEYLDKFEYISPLVFSNGGEGYMLCDDDVSHLGYCERSYFESPEGQNYFKDRFNRQRERERKQRVTVK